MLNTPQIINLDDDPIRCGTMLDCSVWSNEFTYQQIQVLSRYFQAFRIEKEGVVFNEGEPGGTLCILTKGKINILKNNKVLTTLLKGRSFGEMSLIDNQPRSAQAIAVEYSEYLSMNAENLNELSKEHPSLAMQFILQITRLLSQRLRQTSGQLCEFLD